MKTKEIIAAFDFDGTLIPFDAFLPYLEFVVGKKRLYLTLISITGTLFLYLFGLRDRQELKEALLSKTLKGKSLESVEALAIPFFEEKILPHFRKEILEKVQWHKNEGHRLVIISANIEPILKPVQKYLQFDDLLASKLEGDGALTGKLVGKNCRGIEKVNRLKKWVGNLDAITLYAYGDSSGDKELLEAADFPHLV